MSLSENIKRILPKKTKEDLVKLASKKRLKKFQNLPKLSKNDFEEIVTKKLGVSSGDVVFIHSSSASLSLDFSSFEVVPLLSDIVGSEGTLIFPAYPKGTSYEFVSSGKKFNVRRTPSYTGLFSELARRSKESLRSFHPTKSVVVLGKNAKEFVGEHEKSPYPYDRQSPYTKSVFSGAKIIGLGVKSTYLSCVHCVDDLLKSDFPVEPYLKKKFAVTCLDSRGDERIVETYVHDPKKTDFDIPKYMRKNIAKEICEDLTIGGMNFFRAEARELIDEMVDLAKKGITIYKKRHYKN